MRILTLLSLIFVITHGDVSFVLVGCAGDLSTRYLWNGLFQIHLEMQRSDSKIRIYGVGRKTPQVLREKISPLWNDMLTCGNHDCQREKDLMWQNTKMVQATTADQYKKLCAQLSSNPNESLRIFYLSIPPFAFGSTADFIHEHCSMENGELKVAFEKPFGDSLQSAIALKESIALPEKNCLLVDHYLGKPILKDMLKFRELNSEMPWGKRSIARIEIKMLEKLDVKGRTSFFNSYGVIRDVMQNHLMEFLLKLIQQPFHSFESAEMLKNDVLDDLVPLEEEDIIVGQYDNYLEHLKQDTGKDSSDTPTYAKAEFRMPRWRGTRFVLEAGKALPAKKVYARVQLKDKVCQNPKGCQHLPNDVWFILSHPNFGSSTMLFTKRLHQPHILENWKYADLEGEFENGNRLEDYWAVSVENEVPAYHEVLRSLVGDGSNFVRFSSITRLWKRWMHVLEKKPEFIYASNKWVDVELAKYQKSEL